MNSRERVKKALEHGEADRVPVDMGGSLVTGMQVSMVYKLRQALGLDAPGTPVKVIDPFQMLGEIAPDLMEKLGIDVICLGRSTNLFGFRNENWKPWKTFDGTPVLVGEGFNTEPEPNGDIMMYPEGDRSAPPSGRMPKGGWYFDAIARQEPIDDEKLNVEDNLEEFGDLPERELEYLKNEADRLFTKTDKAIFANFGGTAFGDIALVPAPWLKNPKGIRGIEEWYMSTVLRKGYVYEVFEKQCERAIKNLEKIYRVVGDSVTSAFITGTDFGMQSGPFISPNAYRDLYKPFHRRVNDWIHRNTKWKTFMHSCGSVRVFLDDFVEAGFDVLNPVQISAAGMDARELKKEFGKHLTFWGGGVDTQKTLPFGKPEDVRKEVRERLEIFMPGGGFVFNPIHNVQAQVPVENLIAMFETVRKYGKY